MTITDQGVLPSFDLPTRLELARRHAGMSQVEIAERLGLSMTTISRYERGEGTPKRPTIMAWAAVTGVSLDWLPEGLSTPPGTRTLNPLIQCISLTEWVLAA